MLRRDGTFVVYQIQHYTTWPRNSWANSSHDFFGKIPGYHECWQRTGLWGIVGLKKAKKALAWIRTHVRAEYVHGGGMRKVSNKDHKFRLVRRTLSQQTVVVPEKKSAKIADAK